MLRERVSVSSHHSMSVSEKVRILFDVQAKTRFEGP